MICVETMTVCPKTVTLKLGSWYYGARAVVFPDYADCTDVEWCSDKENVVAVNESSGYIYAKNPGTARVYAHTKDGSDIYDYITVTVQDKIYVSSIELCPTSISVAKDDCVELSATVLPENATKRALSWSSSNPSVAGVYQGKVCGFNEGTATITATATDDSGKSATCQVKVTGAVLVESITVYPATKTLEYGKADFLHATVCPENAVNKTVEWSSSDPDIVVVSPTEGIVYGKDAGTATVFATATDGSGVQGSSEVTVNPFVAVEGITIFSESEVMNVGDTLQLAACVCPENATNKSIRWSSNNEEVATVDYYTGKVTAHKAGTAEIVATTVDGGVVARCVVSITNFQEGTIITPENANAVTTWSQSQACFNTIPWSFKYETWYTTAMAVANAGGNLGNTDAKELFLTFLTCMQTSPKSIELNRMILESPKANANFVTDINNAIFAAEIALKKNTTTNISTATEFTYNNLAYDSSFENLVNNWHLAIGAYRTWMTATVTRKGDSYTMVLQYNLRDIYDWNPDNTNMGLIVSQAQMHTLHEAGMAKEYKVIGSTSVRVTWNSGQTLGNGASWTYE